MPTRYNGYDYTKDPHKTCPPESIAAMIKFDAWLETQYPPDQKLDAADRNKRWCIEHADRRRGQMRLYREQHRNKKSPSDAATSKGAKETKHDQYSTSNCGMQGGRSA